LCVSCGASLAGTHPIRDLLRIDNVETQPALRITSNDEDRQRQGFDIQTVFSWPTREHAIDVISASAQIGEDTVLLLDYAAGATISRINKGLRRRREQSLFGFFINTATGRWTKSEEEEEAGESDPERATSQRVVPFVQDNKNAALLRFPSHQLSERSEATVQHALLRGIELTFQLEEGETFTEPVPSRERRNAILVYEATEGGAGVLSRLVQEPEKLCEVARAALNLMHFENIDSAIGALDPDILTTEPNARCVKGCYRCLLSYYNQPDHELIDRTDKDACRLLLELAAAKVKPVVRKKAPDSRLSLWIQALDSWHLPAPSSEPLVISDISIPLVWRSHRVAAVLDPISPELLAELEARVFSVIHLPKEPPSQPPQELAELLGVQV